MNEDVPPVKVGDELEVSIESVGAKGDGIAKVKGFVLFVANTRKGDQVKVKINKVLRSVGFAEVTGKREPAKQADEGYPEEPEEPEEEMQYTDSEDFGEEK